MLLTAATLLTGRELLRPGWIEVSGANVYAIGAGAPPEALAEFLRLGTDYAARL